MDASSRLTTAIGTDLFEQFRRAVATFSDRPAVKGQGGRGLVYTYRDLETAVTRLASVLQQPQFDSIETTGLLSENRAEWPIAYLAILASGKTVLPIDAGLKLPEIAGIVSNSDLKLLLLSEQFESQLTDLFSDLNLLSLDPSSPRHWHTLLKPNQTFRAATPRETAVLIYTSGTTGQSKTVMLTHRNLLANLQGVEDALGFDERDVFLSVLPLHHTFECTCGFLTPLMNGATVVYARSLKSRDILEDIAFNGVTIMCGVPLLYEKMFHAIKRGIHEASWLKRTIFSGLYALSSLGWSLGGKWGRFLFAGLRKKAGVASIRMFVSGGAPLPPAIGRFFNLIGVDFLQGYGLTECSPVVACNRPDSIRFGSVGLPLRNLDLRIENPDHSGVGEIVVRGPSITPGYLNNPSATAELIRDGWLFTGDLGRLDGGHLWITGRRKSVIVSAAGKNIYPEELEEKLLESPYIIEALVLGRRKDSKQGEEIRAVIVPDIDQFRADHSVSPERPDLDVIRKVLEAEIAAVNSRLADYKRIAGFDIQLEEFEKTSTRKVKRFLYNSPDRSQT